MRSRPTPPRVRALVLAVGAAALAAAAPRAGAQSCTTVAGNLVQNCGFESGSYFGGPRNTVVPNGYTLTGNAGGGVANVNGGGAHSGTLYFNFGDVAPASATLSQTLTTTVGATYQISFYARNDQGADANNLLAVTFGGVSVFSAPLLNGAYQRFTGTGVATGTSTALAFTAYNTPGSTIIDDLSVTLAPAAVPEPATFALFGAGLLAVGGVARQRRRIPICTRQG